MSSLAKAPRRTGGLVSALLALLLAAAGLGCGATAADVSKGAPLSGLYDTPEDLAREFLHALEKKDVPALSAFALTEEEFREVVWPELPASRAERGVPFEYGFWDLHQKSTAALRRTYARYGGRSLELQDVRFRGETTEYETFSVHRDTQVKVRTETGEEVWLDLFGSLLERDGRFKLFSYVTD